MYSEGGRQSRPIMLSRCVSGAYLRWSGCHPPKYDLKEVEYDYIIRIHGYLLLFNSSFHFLCFKCFFAKVEYIADFAKSTLQKCRRKTSVFLQHRRSERQIVYTIIEIEEKNRNSILLLTKLIEL